MTFDSQTPAESEMGYETRLFDNTKVHTVDIVMDDWDGFIANATSEEYADAAVVIDGEVYKNVEETITVLFTPGISERILIKSVSSSFRRTSIFISIAPFTVILAVTSNVVLSLGMVGALSIVRFRTAIKDPLDIAFLFWAIGAGIILAAGLMDQDHGCPCDLVKIFTPRHTHHPM